MMKTGGWFVNILKKKILIHQLTLDIILVTAFVLNSNFC